MSIDFPDVFESTMDAETLSALFSDLARHAEVLEVRLKGGARDRGTQGPHDLRLAEQRLESGDVRGVQIRYRHDGHLWMDTLMATDAGTRLVRVRVPARPGA